VSTTTRLVKASADEVWKVLSDGWLYPVFVVGASRMREVDDNWPEVGSRLHHSVGVWPALINDTTSVLEVKPPTMLRLRARGWPAGEADVTFRIRPQGQQTEVVIEEDATSGPAKLLPKPARDVPIAWRNVETLRRLAFIAENRFR
jgi:hypothetical protein